LLTGTIKRFDVSSCTKCFPATSPDNDNICSGVQRSRGKRCGYAVDDVPVGGKMLQYLPRKSKQSPIERCVVAHMFIAFSADGRSSKIVMAWPECEKFTSANLVGATAAEMVANIRAER
jgi:hypothetical protein